MIRSNALYLVTKRFLDDGKTKVHMALIVAFIVVTAGFSAVVPLFFAMSIDAFMQPVPGGVSAVSLIIAFGVGLVVVGCLEQLQWLTYGPLNLRLQRRLTVHAVSHVLGLPARRRDELSSHHLARATEKGLDAVRDIMSSLVFVVAPTGLELIIAAVIIAIVIDWVSAAFVVAAFVAYVVLAIVSGARIRERTEAAMFEGIEAWGYGMDAIVNARLVKQNAQGRAIANTFDAKLAQVDKTWLSTFRLRAGFGSAQAILFGVIVLATLLHGAGRVEAGTLSVGDLVLLNTYLIRLLAPVETLANAYRDVQAGLGEARLLLDLLDEPTADAPPLPALPEGTGGVSLSVAGLRIERGGATLWDRVEVTIAPGERWLVLGPSGAGKSSLLDALGGLREADAGHVFLADLPLTEATAPHFASLIGVVDQGASMLDGSVRDNICLGAKVSDAEVNAIADALGLSHLLDDHLRAEDVGSGAGDDAMDLVPPNSWSEAEVFRVGEGGRRLSAGERQRIAIARALVKQPRLLIMDEPTSALDATNKAAVKDALERWAGDATWIVASHDLQGVSPQAKVIYTLGHGEHRIGVHGDLLVTDPDYEAFIAGLLVHNKLHDHDPQSETPD